MAPCQGRTKVRTGITGWERKSVQAESLNTRAIFGSGPTIWLMAGASCRAGPRPPTLLLRHCHLLMPTRFQLLTKASALNGKSRGATSSSDDHAAFANAQCGTLTIGKNARCDVVGIANCPQLRDDISKKGYGLPSILMVLHSRSEDERGYIDIVVEAHPPTLSGIGAVPLPQWLNRTGTPGGARSRTSARHLVQFSKPTASCYLVELARAGYFQKPGTTGEDTWSTLNGSKKASKGLRRRERLAKKVWSHTHVKSRICLLN